MTGAELLELLPAELESEVRLGAGRSGVALRVERRERGTPAVALVRVPAVFGTRAEVFGAVRSLEVEVLVDDVLELAVRAADEGSYIPPGLLGASLKHLEPRDAAFVLAVRVAALSGVQAAALELDLPLFEVEEDGTVHRSRLPRDR